MPASASSRQCSPSQLSASDWFCCGGTAARRVRCRRSPPAATSSSWSCSLTGDGVAPRHTDAMGTLAEIGAEVDWPDADASSAARAAARHEDGRLGELAEWLAGVQGTFPPAPPTAVRLVHLDPVAERAADLAAQ